MLNGSTTYSPTCTLSTPAPTSTTRPRFSCPNQRPVSKSVRPSYMCRSEPQMFADVISTRTSVGFSIFASGTSLTLTCPGPSYTTAFMLPPRRGCVPPMRDRVLRLQPAGRVDGYRQKYQSQQGASVILPMDVVSSAF